MVPVTGEETWLHVLRDTLEWHPPIRRTVVIAPHPDDETLGAAGLIAYQRRRGVPVVVIAVTNGEAAYADNRGLANRRRAEQEAALAELDVHPHDTIHLNFPDSAVTQHEDELTGLLRLLVEPDDIVVAPWCLDPHPDHEACGRAAGFAAERRNATLVSYFFWTWHHNQEDSLAALSLCQLNLDDECRSLKAKALAHHKSQLEHDSGSPVLPSILLAPAQRPFETFICHED